jgi:hypothetical protein
MSLLSIGVLLAVLIVGIACWSVPKKRKNKLITVATFTIVIVGLFYVLYFPIWKRHSFNLSRTIRSGETTIPFEVPFLAPLEGSYDLSITCTSGDTGMFSINGCVRGEDSESPRFEFVGQSSTNANGEQKLELGVNIVHPIKKSGILVLSIQDSASENEYKLWVGRVFP